jgi:hypothetical protein
MTRRAWIGLAGGGVVGAALGAWLIAPRSASAMTITTYKSPTCGCCQKWIDILRADGFDVQVEDMPDVTPVKAQHAIPPRLWSCHTSVIEGYAVEGHVPPDLIRRMVQERPAFAGIAVPGMPVGSPGMEQGTEKEPYQVVSFTRDGSLAVYAER